MRERRAERGDKPGYYVVVSRQFVAAHEGIGTVVCAPVYGEVMGLTTEVVIGPESGVPRVSSVRCDFLMLLFKHTLVDRVGTLPSGKQFSLNRALAVALDIGS